MKRSAVRQARFRILLIPWEVPASLTALRHRSPIPRHLILEVSVELVRPPSSEVVEVVALVVRTGLED
jgi:hypothetical protein